MAAQLVRRKAASMLLASVSFERYGSRAGRLFAWVMIENRVSAGLLFINQSIQASMLVAEAVAAAADAAGYFCGDAFVDAAAEAPYEPVGALPVCVSVFLLKMFPCP